MKNLKFLLVFALLATAFVGCKDDDTKEDPVIVPTVSVEAGDATETTIAFNVTSKDAEAVKYLVQKAGTAEVTVEQVMTNGVAVVANGTVAVTVDNLESETAYEVWAAATNKTAVALSEKATITTLKVEEPIEPGDDPEPIEFEAEEAAAEDMGGTWILGLYGSNASVCLELTGAPGEGEFMTLEETVILGENSFYNDFSSGDPVFTEIKEANVTIENVDGAWSVMGELVLVNDTPVTLSYVGAIDGLGGGEDLEPTTVDLTERLTSWSIQPDFLTGAFMLVATNSDNSITVQLSLNGITSAEPPYTFADYSFLTGYDQAELDAWLAEIMGEPGDPWLYWINVSNSGVITPEGVLFFQPHIAESFLTIYTDNQEVDNFEVFFSLLAYDENEVPYIVEAAYNGPLFNAEGGGDEEDLIETSRDFSKFKKVKISQNENTFTCDFNAYFGDCRLVLNTTDGVLATEEWKTYTIEDGSLSTDSYYAEYVEDEQKFNFYEGSVYVRKEGSSYYFDFDAKAKDTAWIVVMDGTCVVEDENATAQPWEYTVESEGVEFSSMVTERGFSATFKDSAVEVYLDFVDANVVTYNSMPGSGFYPLGADESIAAVFGEIMQENLGTWVDTTTSYVKYNGETYQFGSFDANTFNNMLGVQSDGVSQIMIGSMMGGATIMTTADGLGTLYFGYTGAANFTPAEEETAEPWEATFAPTAAQTIPTDNGFYVTMIDAAGNQIGLNFVNEGSYAGADGIYSGYWPVANNSAEVADMSGGAWLNIADSYIYYNGVEYKFKSSLEATSYITVETAYPGQDLYIFNGMLTTADGLGSIYIAYQGALNYGNGVGGLL